MIKVASNALELLGMLGVDIRQARSVDESSVELPHEAFAKTTIRANDLELAARGIDGEGDKRVGADAIALYAAFASSCTKFGVGEHTDHCRTALDEVLAQLRENEIPAPGPAVGRLVALRRSISALLENDTRPEIVALARAAYAAVSESFGHLAGRASEMALAGVTIGDRFPDAWERELARAATVEAEIRQRAKERGGTPNHLTMVSEVVERIVLLGGEVRKEDGGAWRVSVKKPPISDADAGLLSKLVEALGVEMSRLGAMIPAGEGSEKPEPADPRERFWSELSEELHRVLSTFFSYPQQTDVFKNELSSIEVRLANLERDAFLRYGTELLKTAEAEAGLPSRLWMRARDRFWPGGETRAEILDTLADELLGKITLGLPGEDFASALSSFARRAGLTEAQTASLSRFADQLGALTMMMREPLAALHLDDFEQIAAHFAEPKRDSAFYATEVGGRALDAVRDMRARFVSAEAKINELSSSTGGR